MRIAVIWMWERASEIMPNWRDGYRAAWDEIAKKHEVRWFLDGQLPAPDGGWDFVYLWDDSNSAFFNEIDKYSCRKGLSLTTDPRNFTNLHKCDVVFVESDPIYNAVRSQGIRAIRAFGTDTDYFVPNDKVEKDIEYFYPATFSPWKQQSVIAPLYKDKLFCVGTVQPDGDRELQSCKDNGVRLEIGYFPVDVIRDYYWRTKQVTIPAVHGSERTVLECMSMNIPVEVTSPSNTRAKSYLLEFQTSDYKTPRDFVVAKYSHKVFAENLLKGIES